MRRVMLLLCLLLAPIVFAQESSELELSPELEVQIAELTTFTEGTRGLMLPESLPLHFPNRAELRDYITEQFDIAYTEELLAEYVRFYVAFDFLPADVDLRAILDTFYSGQIGGFYDSETKEMNVVLLSSNELSDSLPILEQIVYVHEYTHALQDEAFDLTAYLEESNAVKNGDRQLARLALVEGDATYLMNVFTIAAANENPLGVLAGLLIGGAQAGNLTLPAGTPTIIANELLFPYLGGETFVRALYESTNDWSAVNAAFDNPPSTSEQILHPEKYFAGEEGIEVTLVDSAQKMGMEWTLGNEGVLGEFYLAEYLKTQLSESDANDAAAGWGGDAYHIYMNEAGELALMLRLEWDTPEDQAEFEAAMAEFGQERYGVSADESGCYETADQTLCTNGRVVLVAPTKDLALLMVSE